MASSSFRRSISTVRTLVSRRVHHSYCCIHRNNSDDDTVPSFPRTQSIVAISSPHCPSYNTGNSIGLQFSNRSLLSAPFLGPGSSFSRYMSSASGEGSLDVILTEVIEDSTVDVASQVPAVSEVAIAAADSAYPVAVLQHFIDGVHSFTGLNWWASIALTTVLIRGATVPLLINQLKSTSKLSAVLLPFLCIFSYGSWQYPEQVLFLEGNFYLEWFLELGGSINTRILPLNFTRVLQMMRPHLEELNKKFKELETVDADDVAKHKQRVMELFKKFGVTPFTPLKGLLIQGPVFISFFLAIRNMAEKVPSFQTGGTLWFVDLTTPDSFYILPILTSLTFWITVECNMQEGMEGNPIAVTMKNFSRILAVVAVPVMLSFPKALFCYWLTSNIFSLTYGLVIRQPTIKKMLNIPLVLAPVSPAVNDDHASSSPSTLDEASEAETKPRPSSEPSKTNRRISTVPFLSQRIRNLKKKMKAAKKSSKS